jgi:hypothetical protein
VDFSSRWFDAVLAIGVLIVIILDFDLIPTLLLAAPLIAALFYRNPSDFIASFFHW